VGCPVYFGSVIALSSVAHGGFLATDNHRTVAASSDGPFASLGSKTANRSGSPSRRSPSSSPPPRRQPGPGSYGHIGGGRGSPSSPGSPPGTSPHHHHGSLFTVWSADMGDVGKLDNDDAHGSGGVLRFGDAVYLQCGAHKPTVAAIMRTTADSAANKATVANARVLGSTLVAEDAVDVVSSAVNAYHANRASHAFALEKAEMKRARAEMHRHRASTSGSGSGSGGAQDRGGGESEGMSRQTAERIAKAEAAAAAEKRREAAGSEEACSAGASSSSAAAAATRLKDAPLRLVTLKCRGARTELKEISGGGNVNGPWSSADRAGSGKGERGDGDPGWRASARWVVVHAHDPVGTLGSEVRHGDPVCLQQEWAALSSASPTAPAVLRQRPSPELIARPANAPNPLHPGAPKPRQGSAGSTSGNQATTGGGGEGGGGPTSPRRFSLFGDNDASKTAPRRGSVFGGMGGGGGINGSGGVAAPAVKETAAGLEWSFAWKVACVYLPDSAPLERGRQV